MTPATLAAQYHRDLTNDQREDTAENRRAWLWFQCPANLRGDVEPLLGPLSDGRSESIRIRLNATEKQALTERANREGKSVSALVRDTLCR